MTQEKKTPFVKAWLPWHGADFYNSFAVKQMSLEEEAVYHRWIWAAWCDSRCSLPVEEAALRKISAGFMGDLTLLLSCWFANEGRLYNERLLKEWLHCKEISRKNTAAVNLRYPNAQTTDVPTDVPTNDATNTLRNGLRTPYSSSSSSSSTKHTEDVLRKTDILRDREFDDFWKRYPKKRNKKKARKAWHAATDKPPLDKILAAIEQQCRSKQWTSSRGKFIPYPENWLRDGCWTDQLPEKPRARLPL